MGMQNRVYSWVKWYSKEENIKHRQYRERLAAENPHLEELVGGPGGGGGLDLIVNVNYLDKIRSFWFVFVRLI